jgi:SecD/SecF fusion protein
MIKHMRWVIIAFLVVGGLSLWAFLDRGVQLGLDLRGGSVLTYYINTKGSADPQQDLRQTADVLRTRIDSVGLKEIPIEELVGESSLRISLPGREKEEVDSIKKLLQQMGKLELMIVARDGDPTKDGELDLAIAESERADPEIGPVKGAEYLSPGKVISPDYPGFAWYPEKEKFDDTGRPLPTTWRLLRTDRWSFTGEDLTDLKVRMNSQGIGDWIVLFSLKTLRQNDFGKFTGPNSVQQNAGGGRFMAIVLDGKINSAPILNTELTVGGLIEGDFTQIQATELVNVLRSGSLRVKPQLESEYSVGPSLGEDAIRKGTTAILIGFILVVATLIYYYMVQGVIANFALLLNLAFLVGLLSFFGAALTLPGLAGIVLTVGMAVDANILINERIREEKAKGKTILQAVKNGYDRAFLTIVDANLTTVITAIILWQVGTGPVQGFAVTLIIGILASMFTALVVSRLILELLLNKGIIKDVKFTPLLLGERHAKYMKLRPLMIGISILLVVGGFALFEGRGEDKYDIDFTGGAEVRFRLCEPMEIAEVRKLVIAEYPDASVVSVKSERVDIEDLNLDKVADQFAIKAKVTEEQEKAFETFIRTVFAGRLQPNGLAIRAVNAEDGEYEAKHLAGQRLKLSFVQPVTEDEVRGIMREAGEDSGADAISVVAAGSWNPTDGPEDVRTWHVFYETQRGDILAASGDVRNAVRTIHATDEGAHIALTDPIPATTFIGAGEARDIRDQALRALLLSLIAQIIYIAFRFKGLSFGFAAVIALIHDVAITLGVVALMDMAGIVDVKINLPIIAAFLTLIGYSMNDTIVIFDRIRENKPRWKGSFSDLIDTSVNQNLARTLRTSFTTFVVLAVIFIVNRGAASVLEGFSFVMLVGVITGTYSSIFIASPMLMFLPWYWRKFKDIVIVPLWTKAGPAKIVTWAIILAILIASPIWVILGLVRWVFIPDADRALNMALRTTEKAKA